MVFKLRYQYKLPDMRSCINSLAVSLDPRERKGGGWEREELINLHNQEYSEEAACRSREKYEVP